jgi:predicted ferric reductase
VVRGGASPAPRKRMTRVLGPWLLGALLLVNLGVITGLWIQHGGWPADTSRATLFTSIGQITALWGTFAALVQILLVARVPGLDGRFGMDRLVRWHRWTGFSLAWCLLAHVVATTIGWAAGDGRSSVSEFFSLNRKHTSVLLASAATVLLVVVAVTSARVARGALSRETWFFIHLLSYLMMGLSFPHIVQVGSDFDHHRWTTWYWGALYLSVIALVVWNRFGNPVRNTRRHKFALAAATEEAPGVVSLSISGQHMHRFDLRAGQFVTVRFLARGWSHRAHPFSVSGVDRGSLRLTVKALGDDSARIHTLRPGTRVVLEGPYGAFTEMARTRRKVLLVAGGIGITPIRLLFEHLQGEPGDISLIYRASSHDDVVFGHELDAIAEARGCDIHYLVGSRTEHSEVFTPESLRALVPDVAERDVYLCGPGQLVSDALTGLRAAGVPRRHVHFEDFSL